MLEGATVQLDCPVDKLDKGTVIWVLPSGIKIDKDTEDSRYMHIIKVKLSLRKWRYGKVAVNEPIRIRNDGTEVECHYSASLPSPSQL